MDASKRQRIKEERKKGRRETKVEGGQDREEGNQGLEDHFRR